MADDDLVTRLLRKARELAAERQAVYKDQESNRRLLRDLASQGVLSPAQVAEVAKLYPPRRPRGEGRAEQES